MGMKSRVSALVVAMVGVGVISQASASVVGQTSTQVEFSYQLIDLDVNDGITPSISIWAPRGKALTCTAARAG